MQAIKEKMDEMEAMRHVKAEVKAAEKVCNYPLDRERHMINIYANVN